MRRTVADRVRVAVGAVYLLALAPLAACGNRQPALNLPPPHSDPARQIAGDSSASLRFARAARDAGDLAAAVRLYRTLAAEPSATPALKAEFGNVLLAANMPDDAIDAFSQVPPGASERLDALLGLTKAHISLAQPTQALAAADQALARAPHDERVLVDRGVALDSLGRHAEAQASYRAALATAPRAIAARNDLALSLAVTGQYDEAIALLTPLARSSEATPRIRENLALVYGLMGDAGRAASLSRADLDDGSIRANLEFLATIRGDAAPNGDRPDATPPGGASDANAPSAPEATPSPQPARRHTHHRSAQQRSAHPLVDVDQ
jgi:Flp pilus assembly protein TadD